VAAAIPGMMRSLEHEPEKCAAVFGKIMLKLMSCGAAAYDSSISGIPAGIRHV
jgi:hypothetical protein